MRATTILSLVSAALLLGGCMAGGTGETQAPLEKVEKAEYTDGVMWMEPGADRPVSAAELDEGARANPVRVEFYDDLATAWLAPEGEARYGRHNLVAVWRVWDHTGDIRPLSDDVAPDGEEDAESYETPDSTLEAPDLTFDVEDPADTPDVDTTPAELPYAIIEWRNRFTGENLHDDLINTLDEAHPGCI